MPPITDAQPESSTGEPEEGFAQFQAEQSAKTSVQDSPPEKVVPDSEPVNGAVPPKKEDTAKPKPTEVLTDEEKSARKHANDDRRIPKLYRTIGEKDAEIARLNREIAAKGTSAPPAKQAVDDDPSHPRPKQEDFTDFDEYVDARSTWNARKVLRDDAAERSAETHAKTVKEQAVTFMDKIGTYAESNEGFMDAFETVRDALETDLPVVSAAIAGYEQTGELIDKLGNDETLMARILEHKGNPSRALMELGKIIATMETASTVSAVPKPAKTLPRAPAVVGARRSAPTGESVLDEMALKDELPMDWRDHMPRKR